MSDHIVTFWIKFRRDKKVGFSLQIKFWFRGYFWTKSCLRKNLGTKPCKILIWGYFLRKKGKSLRNILKISDHSCVHIVNICAPPTHTHLRHRILELLSIGEYGNISCVCTIIAKKLDFFENLLTNLSY